MTCLFFWTEGVAANIVSRKDDSCGRLVGGSNHDLIGSKPSKLCLGVHYKLRLCLVCVPKFLKYTDTHPKY